MNPDNDYLGARMNGPIGRKDDSGFNPALDFALNYPTYRLHPTLISSLSNKLHVDLKNSLYWSMRGNMLWGFSSE